jgi:Icc protein
VKAAMGLTVGHLTDLHVVARGDSLFGVDTVRNAERAIAHLAEFSPHPDVVIVTGDVTAHGEPSEYAVARQLLDDLGTPYYVVPGNHDRRGPFVAEFGSHAPVTADGFVQYTVDVGGVRLVGLDTLDEGVDGGLLSSGRLAWLSDALAVEAPTLVFLHHPPFATGIAWMDEAALSGASDFAEILARHPEVALVACGHIHRAISATVGSARVAVGPSTAFEVYLDLVPDNPRRVVMGPPAYLVHHYDGTMWVTHETHLDESVVIDIAAYDMGSYE